MRKLLRALAVVLAGVAVALPAAAQVTPSGKWTTVYASTFSISGSHLLLGAIITAQLPSGGHILIYQTDTPPADGRVPTDNLPVCMTAVAPIAPVTDSTVSIGGANAAIALLHGMSIVVSMATDCGTQTTSTNPASITVLAQ